MKRHELIGQLQSHLQNHQLPRLQMMVILAICGMTAFLCSAGMLVAGVGSMATRYGIAGIVGYVTFMLLIRVWIAWQQNVRDSTDDVLDLLDPDLVVEAARAIDLPDVRIGTAGRSGWADVRVQNLDQGTSLSDRPVRHPARSSIDLDLDLDEAWWLVVALAAALAGITAIVYVVYLAPALLAEVALDAVLLSTVYRRLRNREVGHWAHAVVRRTWIPALVLIVSLVVAGYALQQAVPDARSIGGVLRAWTE